MEAWGYASGGKGFESKEAVSPSDSSVRSKIGLMGWELKTSCNFGDNTLISGQHAVENLGLEELGFQELIGKQLPGDSIRDGLNCKNAGAELNIPFTATQNVFSRDDDSTSKLSSSVVDSISQDSALIDLKLGRLNDQIDAHISTFSHGISAVSSSQSLTPQKRMRVSGVNFHTANCQVYGCGKDLSSSKDYHKRHKVCEVHSKTTKVIVKGIEQRFCQQCSRFHLLAEFDDGKRSCRKRLAGHNERRRKPQFGVQRGRPGRLHPLFGGFADGKLLGTTLPATSFICQDILPSTLLHPERDGTNDWFRRIKVEQKTAYSPLLTNPMSGLLHSESVFPSYNFEKSFPRFQDNGANTRTGSILCENSGGHPHDSGYLNAATNSLLHDISLGSEDFTVFDTASTIRGVSGITDSGYALSLLSSRSQNSSSHISGNSASLVMPSIYKHATSMSETFIGASSKAESSGLTSKFTTSKMKSTEGSHFAPMLISDSSDAMNYEITGGIFPGSDFVNARDRFPASEGGSTIDLLQLSSQLQ